MINRQFVKLYSWMNDLGLSLAETVVFALIFSYTEFKGRFDGTTGWLAGWTHTTEMETARILADLINRGLIFCAGRVKGVTFYKSVSIDSIDNYKYSIDSIDKNNNNNSIDSIDNRNKNNSIDSIDSRAGAARDGRPRKYRLAKDVPEIMALIDEFGGLDRVPRERLRDTIEMVRKQDEEAARRESVVQPKNEPEEAVRESAGEQET